MTTEKFDAISFRLHTQLVQAITDTADRLGIPETDEEIPASVLAKIEARVRDAETRLVGIGAALHPCENYVPPTDCKTAQRDLASPFAADGYCLPCKIRAHLA